MPLIVADRVAETSTTTGTGPLTLAAALQGFRRFSAVCSTSDTAYYVSVAVDANGNPSGDWEAGLGTYSSANTLTRTTVHASSNAGAAVNFAAGTKYVFLEVTAAYLAMREPQEWAPNFSSAGEVYIPATSAMTVAQGNATIGTGTLTYAKSTAAAPSTFSATTLPTTLEAGAWLRVTASGVAGFVATHLKRTA